jgi:RIO kinase 1
LNDKFDYQERYFDFQEQYARPETRKNRRKRKKVAHHVAKKSEDEILADIAETIGLEGGFNTTYTPALHEEGFLLEAIKPFYEEELITDVTMLVKGGKEANVYCCTAGIGVGADLLACKVYRPRKFRTIRNDAIYRQGRKVLDNNGVEVLEARELKALAKKTGFGVNIQHTSWLAHEFVAMNELWDAGAAVPQPLELSDNAILMAYIGAEFMAAPPLNSVRLERHHAKKMLEKLLYNIELMLAEGWIHGDLSAFNILYWEDDVTIIDFPQVINPKRNRDAYNLLHRDVLRVCQYFARQRVNFDPESFTRDLWQRYHGQRRVDQLADESRFEIEVEA